MIKEVQSLLTEAGAQHFELWADENETEVDILYIGLIEFEERIRILSWYQEILRDAYDVSRVDVVVRVRQKRANVFSTNQ